MTEPLEDLEKKRKNTLLVNLIFSFILLVLGVLIFLTHLIPMNMVWIPVLLCAAFYIAVVRRAGKRYVRGARGVTLREIVCEGMNDFSYEAKGGVKPEIIWATGLIQSTNPDNFLSREHVTGTIEGMDAELADISFPITENGHASMFIGSFIGLTVPGANFSPLVVKEGNLDELGTSIGPGERKLIEELGDFIPGSLYLHMQGERMEVLLQGRFLGYRIKRTKEVTDTNPYPEFLETVNLAQKMRNISVQLSS